MAKLHKHNQVPLFVFAFLLLLSIPLTTTVLTKPQETKSHAQTAATYSFVPVSGPGNPLKKNLNDPIDLDLYVDPGGRAVTSLRYRINFDPVKVKLAASPFDANANVFASPPKPEVSGSYVAQTLTIKPGKPILKRTKVGTLHAVAVNGTGLATTTLAISKQSFVLVNGANVLSAAPPAHVIIAGEVKPMITLADPPPGTTPATGTTPDPGTATPTPGNNKYTVKATLLLHGVGNSGDTVNPSSNSMSNKTPIHQERPLRLQVFNSADQQVREVQGKLTYAKDAGNFTGTVEITNLPEDSYTFKVQTDRYLRKKLPDSQKLTANQTLDLPSVELVAGDTNSDNAINILDYNALLDCGYGKIDPKNTGDQASIFKSSTCQVHAPADNVDIDDNGVVNSVDYNLFLREYAVQKGD